MANPLSTYVSAVIVTDGCTAYWPLSETSGTTVNDVAGNFLPGVYHASPSLNVQPGPLLADPGSAVTFASASSQYVSITTSPGLAKANFTADAWVKWTGTNANQWIVGEGNSSSTNPIWGLMVDSATGTKPGFTVRDASLVSSIVTSPNAVNDGQWHHIAGTCVFGTPTVLTLYVDGVQVGTGSGANTATLSTVNTFSIAALTRTSVGSYFNGTIGAVGIYGSVLSAQRIQAHYYVGRQANFLMAM